MISGIVPGSMTVASRRRPPVGCMAVITLHSRHEMPLGFAGGCGTVMTGVTTLANTGVIEINIGP
jgi:hypothetical protein